MAQDTEHENVSSFVLSLHSMLRSLATILLLSFLLVLSAGAVHTHGAELFQAEHVEQCVDTDAHDSCSLCDATKDVHATPVIEHHSVFNAIGRVHEPVVANLISDRCPLQAPGRAPPTTI